MNAQEPLDRIAGLLGKLPGVGRRSASRMAYALARNEHNLMGDLAAALREAEQQVAFCSRCGNLTLKASDPCRLCTDPRRDDKVVCVVEDPADISLIEKSGAFRGRYHALLGKLSPMRGLGAHNTRMDALLERVARDQVAELILALNSDVESDATAAFITEALAKYPVRITRLARGIPAGSGVAYADAVTLAQAIQGRRTV